MRSCVVSLFVLLIAGQFSFAKPWSKVIQELSAEERTEANKKELARACDAYGTELLLKQKLEKAVKWLEIANEFHPAQQEYETHLAAAYFASALHLFEQRTQPTDSTELHSESKVLALRALSIEPKLADAHVFIARIEYENQNMQAALDRLEAARKINPNAKGIREIEAKVIRENQVEKQFRKLESEFFEVRFHRGVDMTTAQGLVATMEYAREVVGKDLAHLPKHKVVLLVYTPQQFSSLRMGPHWAGGLYDGKIRLPLNGRRDLRNVVATLFHEYTHAVIHDLSKGKCPIWLNEGLAEIQGQKAGKTQNMFLEVAAITGRMFPIQKLDLAFHSPDARTAKLGYEQAHSLTRFMIKKFKYSRIQELLEQLGNDVPFELALRKTCRTTTHSLTQQWKNKNHLKSGGERFEQVVITLNRS